MINIYMVGLTYNYKEIKFLPRSNIKVGHTRNAISKWYYFVKRGVVATPLEGEVPFWDNILGVVDKLYSYGNIRHSSFALPH